MIELGIFLARMQPVHNAHLFMVREALQECEHVCIVLGSENKDEMVRNPFKIELRETMLRECLLDEENKRITIFTLPDWTQESDTVGLKQWGAYLYYNIVSRMEQKHFTFYYSDDPEIMLRWFTDELLEYVDFRFFERTDMFEGLSATKIREAFSISDLEYIKKFCPQSVVDRFAELGLLWFNVTISPREDFSMK